MADSGQLPRAFWVESPSRGAIRSAALRRPAAEEIVVETLFSGISRGTESLIFRGDVPPSQYTAMRCPFQEGEFPAPVKYGYSVVGRVADGPAALRDRTVFVLHPHQTRLVVPAASAVLLPEDVPPGRAVLAANLETALNGIWDAMLQPGDRVCVIGAGVVGLLVAWLAAQIVAVNVLILDIDPDKARVAGAFGLEFRSDTVGLGTFDMVIHASGNPAGLRTALDLAGFEALILEMSWFGKREVSLPLGEAFHARRLRICSSQVGAVAATRRGRWSHRARLELAVRLLADDRLDHLISGESPFDSLPEVMAELAVGARSALCHRIRYG